MSKNKIQPFIMCYKILIEKYNLTLIEAAICGEILSFERANKKCYYSQEDFGKKLGVSKGTINTFIQKLKNGGWITWVKGSNKKGKCNIYSSTSKLRTVIKNEEYQEKEELNNNDYPDLDEKESEVKMPNYEVINKGKQGFGVNDEINQTQKQTTYTIKEKPEEPNQHLINMRKELKSKPDYIWQPPSMEELEKNCKGED